MVAGLKFLSKKGFNPQNLANQKRVWEKEQQEQQESRRIKEREAQLRRERDDEELAKARGDALRLNFMYDAPPGLKQPPPKANFAVATTHFTERQPGDDDAAAAFRRMLAAATEQNDAVEQNEESKDAPETCFGTVLRGALAQEETDRRKPGDSALTALEKAVGRKNKNASGHILTLDEQIQRFPALKNAPRAKGISESDVGVTFKPLGSQIRNVKCMACGEWGHSRGDRECKQSGWNPFEAPARSSTTHDEEMKPSAKKRHRDDGKCDSSEDRSTEDSISRERKHKRKHKKSKRKHRRKTRSRSKSPERSRY